MMTSKRGRCAGSAAIAVGRLGAPSSLRCLRRVTGGFVFRSALLLTMSRARSVRAAGAHKHPAAHAGSLGPADFIDWLRELHGRQVEKEHAWLWSPAEFERKDEVTTGRGLANITAIWGVWMDNDGGDLSADEFAALFPHLMMVIHNSASSTPDAPRWRAIIPTTCAMTIEVHREISLNSGRS
jgi:hypothetical protein